MPEETFRDEVMKLGGTPPEFFRYPELLGYMLPILRNDFRLSETLPLHTVVNPLGCGLTVFSGKEEKELTAEGVHGWMAHTTRVCNVHYFNGGHFFINNETERMLQIINATLISA